MTNEWVIFIVATFLLLYYILIAKQLKRIEESVKTIEARTPIVPYGTYKHDDGVIYGSCPSCHKIVTNKDNPDECLNCYQRLDWRNNCEKR